MLFRELNSRAKKLRLQRNELVDQLLELYKDLVKEVVRHGSSRVFVIGYFEELNNRIVSVDEGIIVEDGIPYYVNKNKGAKWALKGDEEIKSAIKETLGDLILLEDPQIIISNVVKQLTRNKRGLWPIRSQR